MFYRETVLPNGITIRTEHMDSVRSITLGIWFKVGSRDETSREAGLSHFMEHMFFKGTSSRSASQISGAFDELGAELNAFTSKEYTCYYARFVDEKLEHAMELLSDMLVNSQFAPDCIESEREVVIEEIARSEDSPEEDVYDVFHEAMFPTHTLGRPVLGSRESVRAFVHDDCAGYLKKHYNTSNCCVAAAGNIDHDVLVDLVKRYLASMPTGERTVRDLGKETDRLFSRFIQKDTEQAHMVIGAPGLPIDDSDRFAHSLLDMLFGGSMASRLFQEVREKNGLAYAVFAESIAYQGEGAFSIYAGTRPENLMKVATIIKRELNRIIDEGATLEELERVRNYAVGQTLLRTEATRNHMTRLGKSSVTDAELLSFEEAVERYNAVTLDQVNDSVQRIYSQVPTIAVISPLKVDEVEHIMEHALM